MKGKKVVLPLLIGFVVFFISSAYLSLEAWGSDNVKQIKNGKTEYVLKIGTLAPKGVGWTSLLKTWFTDGILKATNGRVVLDWYYGGSMGDDQDIIAKMRNGQLQGAGFTGYGMVMGCPEMALIELPFLFDSYDEVEYVYSKLRPRMSQWFEKRGNHLVLLVEQDFDQLYSIKHEIKTPEDFKDSKFLTWYGPLEEKTLKALGASPLPIRVPEASASIHSGVCNAFLSPAFWAIGAQMYTSMKYINTVHLRYSPASVVISLTAWNQLPNEDQVTIDNFVASIEKEFRWKVRASNQNCIEAMVKYGMKKTKMTTAEIDVFKKRVLPVWDEFIGKYYSKAELEEVKGYLAEFRSKNKK